MLYYNFDRIFKARGIYKPFSFLKNAGYSESFSSKIKNNKVNRLELRYLESLCLLLKCTPNDVLVWIPDSGTTVDETHPMHDLKKSANEVDMVKTINSIPIGKLEQIEKLIKEELKRI